MTTTWRTGAALLALVGLLACRGEAPTPSEAPEDAPQAEAPEEGPGLQRPVREALTCDWRGGFSVRCAPYAAWLEALEDAEADAALVDLLGREDRRIRYLAASGLLRRGTTVRTDADLARRVVDAAREERDPAVATPLGGVAARLDLEAAGRVEQVEEMASGHPLSALRAALVGDLLVYGGARWSDVTRRAARSDRAPEVRAAALSAFWAWGGGEDRAVCGLWLEQAKAESDRVAAKAAYLAAFSGRCGDRLDDLLALQEERARQGGMTPSYVAAVEAAHDAEAATDEQRSRALRVARATAGEADNGWAARDRALDLLVDHDPEVRAFLEDLRDEAPALVRAKLEALDEPPTEP
ncbi:MAG: hypothetical protein ACQEXJ_20675 [Myxococcota bacterium]